MLTKDDIAKARRAYAQAIEEAEQRRAATFAQAIAEGMAQKDIIEATGYSRETVRRIVMKGQKRGEEMTA
jgi:transposase